MRKDQEIRREKEGEDKEGAEGSRRDQQGSGGSLTDFFSQVPPRRPPGVHQPKKKLPRSFLRGPR
jgi:hypothetical protein